MKKLVSIFLSIALVFSVISVNNISVSKINAQENDWSSTAITVPAEGELVGAGYIDVEFNNSMEGYTYTVYLDGEPMYWVGDDIVRTEIGEQITEDAVVKSFTSQDKGKTEVYTTNVSRHELVVKANNGSDEQVSETRTFYVSKKGMALGGDMSDKVSLKKLNCSWYYNWATDAFNNSIDEGVDHIPMMWGDADDNKEGMANMSSTANYILGFNEPDIKTQADMFFFEGIETWKEYISPLKMRKVSPAPAAPGGDSGWLKLFMNGGYKCRNPWDGTWGLYSDYLDDETKTWVEGMGNEVDAVVLHYYRNQINLDGLIAAIKNLWETYHKPIWVTELSIFGIKGLDTDHSYELPEKRAAMAEFVKGIVEKLDAIPYVERYCWFSYDIDSTNEIDVFNGSGATAMFEYASGAYTELGRLYSSIGNPEGYKTETISDDEMFVYVPEENTTKEPVTTTVQQPDIKNPVTTVVPVTKKMVKPVKAKLSKAQNVKKRSVKLTWKKVSGATKYQVQYAMNKKFTKKLKRKTTKKTTLKIAKLIKKKKYYFRVRAVNKIGNGKWSNIKSVKIKK